MLEKQCRQKARLIVGDTLSRLSAGANESAGQDMGLVVRHFDRIRNECSAHFMLIHHSGKNAAAGARGWSGVRAAVDTEIEVTDWLVASLRRGSNGVYRLYFSYGEKTPKSHQDRQKNPRTTQKTWL